MLNSANSCYAISILALKKVISAALYVTFYLCWNKIPPIRKMAVKFLKTQNVVTF